MKGFIEITACYSDGREIGKKTIAISKIERFEPETAGAKASIFNGEDWIYTWDTYDEIKQLISNAQSQDTP